MFTEDLDAFLDTDDFAESVTVNGTAKAAIFDLPGDAALQVLGTAPEILIKSTDITKGATVIARGVTYTAVELRPDGTGFTRVTLQRS